MDVRQQQLHAFLWRHLLKEPPLFLVQLGWPVLVTIMAIAASRAIETRAPCHQHTRSAAQLRMSLATPACGHQPCARCCGRWNGRTVRRIEVLERQAWRWVKGFERGIQTRQDGNIGLQRHHGSNGSTVIHCHAVADRHTPPEAECMHAREVKQPARHTQGVTRQLLLSSAYDRQPLACNPKPRKAVGRSGSSLEVASCSCTS